MSNDAANLPAEAHSDPALADAQAVAPIRRSGRGDCGPGKLVYGAWLGIPFPAGDHGGYQLCPVFTRRWRNRTRIESTLRVTLCAIEMSTSGENLVLFDSPDGRTGAIEQGAAVASGSRPALGTMHRVRVNGIEMNVLLAGQGPDVLLVHGFPDSHAVWRHQIPALVEAGYRVIAPDTRGCGDSEIAPRVADYRVENLVADLVALLDVLGVPKVKLVAHDWGAIIGWQLAIRHPERVQRFIALSVGHPAAYAGFDLMQRLRGWYTLFFQLRGIAEYVCRYRNWEIFRHLICYDAEFPHWRERLSRPGRLTAGLNYYRANLRLLAAHRHPHAVTVPVHGIWSSRDRFLTERQMRTSQRHVRAAWSYTRLDGPNHWLQLDAPERFNPLLLDSLC